MVDHDETFPISVPPPVFVRHDPDTLGSILAIARTAGLAPPTKIRMLPGIWNRIFNESNKTIDPQDVLDIEGIEIVIDEMLPLFPGYEIHREVW